MTPTGRTLCLAGLLIILFAPGPVSSSEAESSALVTAPRAVIRSGPGTGYPVLTTAVEGDRLRIVEESEDWFRILLPREGHGWIYREMVTLEPCGVGPLPVDCQSVDWLDGFRVDPASFKAFIGEGGLRITAPDDDASRVPPPLSLEREIQLGRAVAARLAARYGFLRDQSLTGYVSLAGLVCAENSGRPDLVWRFAVLDSAEVRSASAPGGYVFISRGALGKMENEAQLAGALCRETAHVSRNHLPAEVLKSVPPPTGSGSLPDDILNAMADRAAGIIFRGYLAADELEADIEGTVSLARAGYPADALQTYLERLRADGREDLGDRIGKLREFIGLKGFASEGRPRLAERFAEHAR